MITNKCSNFAVDTIRFLIPFGLQDDFIKAFTIAKSYQRYDVSGNCIYDVNRFRLISVEDMDRSKSYCSDVLFTVTQEGILFEFSIPKFLWGHNVFCYWGLDFLCDFRRFLVHLSSLDLPPVDNWLIKRIDISYSFVLPSSASLTSALAFLKDYQLHGKKCIRRDKEYPYWVFRNRTVKFYDKGLEMNAHKKNFRCSQNYFDYAQSVLRFEEEWRTKHILRLLNLKRVGELTIKAFLNYMEFNYSFISHLSALVGDLTEKVQYQKIEDLYDCLEMSFGRKYSQYIKILNQVLTFGVDYLKDKYPKPTYYRYIQKFRKAGIDLVHFSNFLNEQASESPFIAENYFTWNYLVNDSNYVEPLQNFIENIVILPSNKPVKRGC